MTENNKFLSFSGAIGRKWFFLRSVTALLIPILTLLPAVAIGYFFGPEGSSENLTQVGLQAVTNSLGLFIVIPWMILTFFALAVFCLIGLSLQVRRGRDLFRQTQARPFVEVILLALYLLTRGMFGLGALALFVWPGALARQAKKQPAQS